MKRGSGLTPGCLPSLLFIYLFIYSMPVSTSRGRSRISILKVGRTVRGVWALSGLGGGGGNRGWANAVPMIPGYALSTSVPFRVGGEATQLDSGSEDKNAHEHKEAQRILWIRFLFFFFFAESCQFCLFVLAPEGAC